jgi:UDP-N-acetylmuramoylalanine--D-glutamate ligase
MRSIRGEVNLSYMINYKKNFKNKKITIMGLGLLGRGIGYTKFLAECGADLIVTDLKTKKELAPALKELSRYKNIRYVLGEHRLEDFRDRDMIMKAAGVPLDSIYIQEAQNNNIPIEMDVSLFAQCAPKVTLVGVTGTRGKSMTTALIHHILKSQEKAKKPSVFLGGNVRGIATLPLLKQAKPGDILVCELDSWQLQGFGEAKISPHISVFTTFMPDHMNYYGSTTLSTSQAMKKYFADKANIFKYQTKDDVLVILPEIKKLLPKNIKSKLLIVDANEVQEWDFIVPGEHQRANLACAVAVAKELNIPLSKIKQAVKSFKGLEGRLQYLKTIKGVKIYNDNNATTPQATVAGLEALGGLASKSVILIAGGSDKKLDLKPLIKAIDSYCKAVVLLKGSGTDKLLANKLKIKSMVVENMKDAVSNALTLATKGDIIILSPGFASFGMFKNEYDRNDQFVSIIKKLK